MMPGSPSRHCSGAPLRPATNWPAAARDYRDMASYHRFLARRGTPDATSRAERLAAAFEDLAGAVPVNERSAAEPLPAYSISSGPARKRIGRWPKLAVASATACVLAILAVYSARTGTSSLMRLHGIVTDTFCAQFHPAGFDSECIKMCVARGAKYALVDGANIYALGDQRLAEPFASRSVDVLGRLNLRSHIFQVTSIQAAP